MSRKIIFLSGMTIAAAVSLFCASGHIGSQQVIAFGPGFGHSFGPGFGHFYHPGFGHFYHPGFGYYYSPGLIIDNPCDGGPYSIIDGQVVCTTG